MCVGELSVRAAELVDSCSASCSALTAGVPVCCPVLCVRLQQSLMYAGSVGVAECGAVVGFGLC